LSAIEEVDMLVTIGGAAIGKKDPVWRALKGIDGFSIGFRGIKMKPGRVTSLAWIGEKPVVLIPGHFQSLIVGLAYVLLPIVRAMSGLNPEARRKICEAKLSEEIGDEKYKSFRRIVFVKILKDEVAIPLIAKSFCRKPVVKADGFIEIPEGMAHLEEGTKVKVFWISGLERIPC
jgi:molybdopterin biosynthesis enzyme